MHLIVPIQPLRLQCSNKLTRSLSYLLTRFVEIIREIVVLISDPLGRPSAPTAENVCKDSCELTWHPPDNDGGSPVTGYHVERRASGRFGRWKRITRQPVPDTRYKVTKLVEGNEYQFRISAENSVGVGPPGPESDRVLAKDPSG